MIKKNPKLKIFLGFLVFIFGIFLIFLFSPLPKNHQKPNWFFYDKNGEILYQEKNLNHSKLIFNNKKLFFTKALISLEDKNFNTHFGVNFTALFRAFYQNISEKRVVSGASTITMQLAKILYLPNRKHDFTYKIKQIFYALKLEIKFSKNKILEKYLQRIYFGNNAYGIKEASFKYFSKNPQNLSIGESLMLLSIIQNPSLFNPISHPKNTEKRKNIILKKLITSNILTEKEKNFWQQEKINLNISVNKNITAPHFIFWAQRKIEKFLKKEQNKKFSELHIYTTLDKKKYEKSLHITQEILKNLEEKNISNAAIVALNQNQELEIMLGSPNFFDKDIDGEVNMTTAFRQTGSVLKPFLYALALENNFSPLSILKDEKKIFKSGYFPRNFNIKEFNGKVYFREALTNSYNIAAVYLLNQIGLKSFFDFTQNLGLNFQQNINELGESFVLGSGSSSLLILTKSYSIFKNKGVLKPIKFFTEIKDENQKEIFSWNDFCKTQHYCNNKKIISQNTSDWIKHALSDKKARWKNFEKGNPLELSFASAAKTGTSQNFVDNWVIGFSPSHTVGVWMGNADGTPLHSSSGIEGSGPLWHKNMQFLHQNIFSENFNYEGERKEYEVCQNPEENLSGNQKSKNCSEKFTAFLLKSEFNDLNSQKYKKATVLQNNNLKESLKIIYPKSGDVFMKNSNLLIQVSEKNTKNLEYFLNQKKLNSPIIKNLKSGNYKIKVLNKKSHEEHKIFIEVR